MSEAAEGPGETLQAARLAMEISCREVAEALNLPIHTVEAIEANDYERLPAAVFTRGYIRAYAKLLELDSDPVVARYPAPDDETEYPDIVVQRAFPDVVRDKPEWALGAVAAILVVVVAALAVWLWPSADEPARVAQPERPIAAESEPASATEPAPSAETAPASMTVVDPEVAGDLPAVLDSEPDPQPDSQATQTPATAVVVPEPSAPPTAAQPTVEPAAPPGVRRITPAGSDRLWFRFSEDCWVAIKSADGDNLYSDLSRAGRTLELVGQAPFRILLGYAPGVEMSFNDEVVALAPHTRNNVASLVLGQ